MKGLVLVRRQSEADEGRSLARKRDTAEDLGVFQVQLESGKAWMEGGRCALKCQRLHPKCGQTDDAVVATRLYSLAWLVQPVCRYRRCSGRQSTNNLSIKHHFVLARLQLLLSSSHNHNPASTSYLLLLSTTLSLHEHCLHSPIDLTTHQLDLIAHRLLQSLASAGSDSVT